MCVCIDTYMHIIIHTYTCRIHLSIYLSIYPPVNVHLSVSLAPSLRTLLFSAHPEPLQGRGPLQIAASGQHDALPGRLEKSSRVPLRVPLRASRGLGMFRLNGF